MITESVNQRISTDQLAAWKLQKYQTVLHFLESVSILTFRSFSTTMRYTTFTWVEVFCFRNKISCFQIVLGETSAFPITPKNEIQPQKAYRLWLWILLASFNGKEHFFAQLIWCIWCSRNKKLLDHFKNDQKHSKILPAPPFKSAQRITTPLRFGDS